MQDSGPEMTSTIDIDAEPDEVWEAIVNGELASEWMGDVIAIDARPGGRLDFGDDEMIGTVEEVDETDSDRRIVWSWRHREGLPSQVEIVVEPTDQGSKVTVVERLLEYRIIVAPTNQTNPWQMSVHMQLAA
ncbi:MAG: hypothetical protein GEU79_16225 [Acidimicrobiia bacterium]|nr:hypothetical protein [Acidimicrobiia bacterium]